MLFSSNDVKLLVVQSPKTAKMAIGKEKGDYDLSALICKLTTGTDRKPMDPPPVVQLKIPSDRNQDFMYSRLAQETFVR